MEKDLHKGIKARMTFCNLEILETEQSERYHLFRRFKEHLYLTLNDLPPNWSVRSYNLSTTPSHPKPLIYFLSSFHRSFINIVLFLIIKTPSDVSESYH